MKKAFKKSSRKNIWSTLGRYFSLVGVTLLGAGVFAGLLAIAPEMRETADSYFDSQNLMDAKIQSPLGFTENDINKLKKINSISQIQTGSALDTITIDEDNSYTIRVQSYSDKKNKINQLTLVDGRLPQSSGECVVVIPPEGLQTLKVGDNLLLNAEDTENKLKNNNLDIVGTVKSSLYPHNKQGTTSKGSGNIDFVFFTDESSFLPEYISEIFVTFKKAKQSSSFSSDYKNTVTKGISDIESISDSLANERYQEIKNNLADSEEELKKSKEDAESKLSSIKTQLQFSKAEIEKQQSAIEKEKDNLEENKHFLTDAQYNQFEETISISQQQLDNSNQVLVARNAEFDTQKNDIENSILNGEKKIDTATELLEKVSTPQWYFETRNENQGYSIFSSDAKSMEGMATIFPVIFFLVAALVSLTTMTRMIDDERVLIGTFKSLGYSNKSIASRYLSYSFSATLIGSIVGVFLGFKILPNIIWNAYSHQYSIPDPKLRIHLSYAFLSILTMIIITSLVTLLTVRKSLNESSSELLIPKSPPAGKRIFLEKIPFIWKRLSFSQKVTQRNIFLDKKRMSMTIIGIIGSTALLVTGFALRNSADKFPTQQYEQMMKYDLLATLDQDKASINNVSADLNNNKKASDFLLFEEETIEIDTDSSTDTNHYINLIVPKDSDKISKFISMKNGSNSFNFDKNSIVLTNNIANILNVSTGDIINIKLLDGAESHPVKITNITDNLEMNYLYLSPEIFSRTFNKDYLPNKIFINTSNNAPVESIQSDLDSIQGLSNIESSDDKISELKNNLKSIDMVVIILIILASMLALVVLYNVTNINIEERKREIATIEVLGFNQKEINSYVFRETVGLSLMGLILGLSLGSFLFLRMVKSIETEFYLFDKSFNVMTFIYASVCILLYTTIINLFMMLKIRKINMLESLKSIE